MNFRILFFILGLIITAFFSFINDAFSQSTTFEKQAITNNFSNGTEAFAVDINLDGFIDFISSGNHEGGQVAWWENDGYNGFEKHVVDPALTQARSVCAADLNNDTFIDIVAAGYGADAIRWYENDGTQNWTQHDVDPNFISAHTVDIKDINDDGRPDVLCSSFDITPAFSEIAWWENMPGTSFTKHVISTRFQQSTFIYGEDIDGDGDMDVLACGEFNGEIYWWENDGSQNWTEHMISDDFSKVHTVFARDIDLDGDMDVIGAACMSSSLAWWENDGNQVFTKHPMGTLAGALWFDAVDLDNDGDRDLYAGGQGAANLVWWENNGNSVFTKHVIEDIFTQCFSVVHADFNNDSDTDLVAVGYNSNQIAWFDNQFIKPNIYTKPECVVYDQIFDRYIVANIGNGSLVETDSMNNNSYWVHGYGILYGMCVADGILYTSDGDTLFGFHLATGEEVMSLKITNYNNLDGMTTDGNGHLFVIDTWGRILKVDVEAETYEELVNSGLPNFPQDCVYDPFNDRIVVACYQASAPIVSVDPESGEITTLTTNSVGRYDGITIDQYGNFYFSTHVGGGRVHKYPNDFSDYTPIAYGLGQPTGLNYNQQHDILAVPSFDQDTVYFIHMNQTGLPDLEPKGVLDFEIFPNPCIDKINFRYQLSDISYLTSELMDISGRVIYRESLELSGQGEQFNTVDMSNLSPGVYFLKLTTDKKMGIRKLVRR